MIIFIIIGAIGMIDILLGSPLYTGLLNILYLDGYETLIDKYTDKARDMLRQERYWVNDNYKEYLLLCDDYIIPTMSKYELIREMKRARADGDYITLYNIMKDMDGEDDNQISKEFREN